MNHKKELLRVQGSGFRVGGPGLSCCVQECYDD